MRNIDGQLENVTRKDGSIGVMDLKDVMAGFGIAMPIAGLWMYLVYQGLDLLAEYTKSNGGSTYF